MFKKFTFITLVLLWTSMAMADDLSPEDKYLVEQLVEKKIEELVESDAFQKAVDAGIVRFINEQNQQRAAQEVDQNLRRSQSILPVTEQDYVYGEHDARFTLIEYSDYECPYCKKFHATAETFIDLNPDVNWVYRHFPLDFHNPGAQKQAEAAECAGDLAGDKGFWDYSRKIFERTRSNGKGFPIANLSPLAKELGFNVTAFNECLDSEKYREKVLAQFQQGQNAGVTGTPGNFLVDNKTGNIIAVTGAQPLDALERVLNQLKQGS